MVAKNYRDLRVWARSMDLVVETFRLAAQLPGHQRFELASQMRRAAMSIPANIAEGNGRGHRGEYVHHLWIAHGSALELETHFEIALRLEFLGVEQLKVARELLDHVGRMLNRLAKRLKR